MMIMIMMIMMMMIWNYQLQEAMIINYKKQKYSQMVYFDQSTL